MSAPSELLTAARTAPFVFFGTVRRPTGSNVEMLEGDEYPTAVVRVDEAVTAPEALGDLTGRELTVHLAAPERLARGSRHLFVATSLHFGDEIAVAELGRVPAPRRVEERLRAEIIEARLREQRDALAERLRLATTVVYGVVRRVEPVNADGSVHAEAAGEAAPRFRAAVLKVWRTLKGAPEPDPRVVHPFPRTQKWAEVPLFVEGQEGVWLLQPARGQTLAAGKVPIPDVANGFTALHPLDYQAAGLLGFIEILLAETPKER